MTMTEDPPTFAELRQRILDGGDVTPEAYERARTLAELEQLQQQADQLAAARQAEADRLDAIRAIRARVLAAESLDDDQADMRAITEAAARIITRHGNRAQTVRDAIRDLAKQRVNDGDDPIEGIGWNNAGMGRPEGVTVDGRHLAASSYPGAVIADAILQALTDAGVRRQVITPHVQLIPSNRRR